MPETNQNAGKIDFVDAMLLKLSQNSAKAKDRYAAVPRLPQTTPGECRSIWSAVGFCFTFEQDIAALCACGAFVECFLERAIADFRVKRGLEPVQPPTTLHALILRAREIDLISDDDRAALQGFRKFIRNLYAHGDVDSAANSLFAIKRAGKVEIGDEGINVKFLSEEKLDELRRATAKERLDHSSREFAEVVVPWIGQWAVRCARKVYATST